MPWSTPTLKTVRQQARDYVMGALPGANALIPNSNMRVMADMNAGLAHLNLQYLDWQADQLLPDTNETEFLDRWANMYLVNSDGSHGREQATFASGTVQVSGTANTVVPMGTLLGSTTGQGYETTAQVTLGTSGIGVLPVVATVAGSAGNQAQGSSLSLTSNIASVTSMATVVTIDGGVDVETDDALRVRVLARLAQPPMGGDASDYVQWALAVPGVTRAWCSPNEMGVGTVTIRFMMDNLRASLGGFPTTGDVIAVQDYLDSVRPVTVLDFFVEAPIPEPVNFTVSNLDSDDRDTWANIVASVKAMIMARASPAHAVNGIGQIGQTIFASWVSAAIYQAAGVTSFDLTMDDHPMPNNGAIAVLGTIVHG